jgi:hypothetical protein
MARIDRWLHVGLMATLLVACGSSKQPAPGATCAVNSDCNNPLSCTFGRCHATCKEARDCPTGQRCVSAPVGAVCQLNAQCIYRSDCPSPLACALDRQCRSQCVKDIDCPTKSQKCVQPDGVCAEPDELDATSGKLKNAQSTPVPESPSDAGASDGGSNDAASGADAPVTPADASDGNPSAAGAICAVNSDCPNPLSCTFGHCAVACAESRDCPTSQRCVKAPAGNICLLNGQCAYRSDCPAPLACALDRQCRNQCVTDIDCATATQKCVMPDGVCAELDELNPGTGRLKNAQNTPVPDRPDGGGSSDVGAADVGAASCGDHVQNGNETDIDCGGSCPACGMDKGCGKGLDCASDVCGPAGKCVAPSCTDQVINGDETGIDCGGSCPACPMEATWGTSPGQYRGMIGKRITYHCPAMGSSGSVWGTDTYTDDSSLCTAAVQSGLITFAGGNVTVEIRPGQASYVGSTHNNVTSNPFGKFDGSFVLVPLKVPNCGNLMKDGNETDVDCGGSCQPCQSGLACMVAGDCTNNMCSGRCAVMADWSTNALAYRGLVDARIPFVCPAAGTAGSVYGTDIYTDDSSVCTAAVHAGKTTLAGGGTVTVEIRVGQSSYTGSTRNGITSSDYAAAWPGSFVFP